ncbi:MAG: hypothetical protein GC183_16060 [Thiobacillus sp.]|nr:hypothetical protein [Thiobacillus sp.]
MKSLLKLIVLVCRRTPGFRGKCRLEAWLEKNKDKYAGFGPVIYRVRDHEYSAYPNTNFHLYMYRPEKNLSFVPLIAKYALRGSAVIDLGAYSGDFTICLSDAVEPGGKPSNIQYTISVVSG